MTKDPRCREAPASRARHLEKTRSPLGSSSPADAPEPSPRLSTVSSGSGARRPRARNTDSSCRKRASAASGSAPLLPPRFSVFSATGRPDRSSVDWRTTENPPIPRTSMPRTRYRAWSCTSRVQDQSSPSSSTSSVTNVAFCVATLPAADPATAAAGSSAAGGAGISARTLR